MSKRKSTIASHLVRRLSEVGIKHVFGVPGDYNLELLDYITGNPDLTWVGNTNELNAAYAADGYARCRGISALVTTYGVGELSAINGIAGSYAEYVPVLHIVGSPLVQSEQAQELIHHTLGDGVFTHFSRCAEQVTVAQAKLTPENAVAEIDRVLDAVLREKRPGYIEVPLSLVHHELADDIAAYRPKTPSFNRHSFDALSAELSRLLSQAQRPLLLAGFLAESFGLKQAVRSLVSSSYISNASLFMGKGVLDETHSGYLGHYSGSASEKAVLDAVDRADLILSIGVKYTDNITASFSHLPDQKRLIDFQVDSVNVQGNVFSGIPLQKSVELLGQLMAGKTWAESVPYPVGKKEQESQFYSLTQAAFWQAIQSFIQDGDRLIAEQGTSFFGSAALRIGPNTSYIGQPLWGSIGYTLPATYGAMLAQPSRRTLLFIGDGSALLTLQELSCILRDGLCPIVFLINNRGYTVERAIHGKDQQYNDIPQIDWPLLPMVLGPGSRVKSYSVSNRVELSTALEKTQQPGFMYFIEVHLDVMDLPPQLEAVSVGIAAKNAGVTGKE